MLKLSFENYSRRSAVGWSVWLGLLLEVTLLANSIGLGQPRTKLRVHITSCGKPEGVNMIARRDGLHLAEA
jgi:hypothetical protein